MRAEQLTGPVAFHGEGPVWAAAWGGLRWVDMLAGDVLTLEADGAVSRRHVGEVAAAVRPRRRGGAVVALERAFALEAADGTLTRMPDVWSDPGIRFNDGGCDPSGGFLCGSMAYDERVGAGSLFRLDRDGTVTAVLAGVTISNGLEWSPDGALVYYVDTPTRRIDVFSYEPDDGWSDRRPFVELPPEAGWPDGLTVDASGGVWVAMYDGGEVRRYAPDGSLDAVVEVPTPRPTACTFGGSDLATLFITTTREGLAPDGDPLAGSLFAVQQGATGLPARAFDG